MQISHGAYDTLRGSVYNIGTGVAGIKATTRLMAKIVAQYQFDPTIRGQAINIVQLAPPKDDPAEIRALFDFVKLSIRYVGDVHGVETLQTPDQTLAIRAGDCDDKAILLATLLRSIGYPACFVVTGYSAPNVYEHVYVGVEQPDGTYLALDPTENKPLGWQPENALAFYIERIPG